MNYKVSKFVNILENRDEKIFFNSRTLRLLTGNDDDERFLLDIKTGGKIDWDDKRVKIFIANGFLIYESLDEVKYMKLHRMKRMQYEKEKKNRISYMRISLTESCNLQCKYCFVNTIYKDKKKSNMSEQQFEEYMEWFINQNLTGSPIIQYFGGEPLLRMDLICKGHDMLEQAKKNKKILDYHEEIVTNGTLMNRENAQYLVNSNIDVCFSIDGWKEINDRNRVYPDGKGSFDSINVGIRAYCNNGGKFKAIITPTNENIDIFYEIVEFLVNKLQCSEISINTPQPNMKGWDIDGNKLAEAIKKAWIFCEKMKIPFNAPGTNIVFLVNNKLQQSYSCMNLTYGQNINSYGIYVNSSGMVSNCVVECDSVCTHKFKEFSMNDEYIDWHYIFEMRDSCINCIAANICGGPCKIEYEICDNKINLEKCKFYKNIVPWVLTR